MTPDTYLLVCAGVLGALLGSFMNVLIHRLPRGESVVVGRSHCPRCGAAVRWYDNVPVFAWLWLRGRCRDCRARISPRYVVVELIAATSAVLIVRHGGVTLDSAWRWLFVAILTVITFIDWEHQIIPDSLSIGGTVLGWVGAAVALDVSLAQSIVGSLVGAGVILAIAIVYRAVRHVHGMGGGDVKLMAMIGAFLGWPWVFPVLFVAALFGSLYGLWLMRAGRGDGRTAVAFGSFLAPAACAMMFFGPRLLSLYLAALPPR